ncbi:MAG: hypothetical protein M3N19_10945 [Candidatus Eremiobacteraeota bacterium]|nr:hypothetical protein [Candidatus Eremiobacteraeota bacterium]
MTRYQTWHFDRTFPSDEQGALCSRAQELGLVALVESSTEFACTYVVLEIPEDGTAGELAARYPGATIDEGAVIALGIHPQAQDALPELQHALEGPGAPGGVLRAAVRNDALLLAFDPERTSWMLIKALIDAELLRFGSTTRRTTLLSPVTPHRQAQIAADGLRCIDIEPARVLETYANQHVDR